MFRKTALLAAPLLLWPALARAQVEDGQLWLAANAQIGVAQGERLTLEAIGRFSDRNRGFFHSEFGAIGAVDVAKGVEVAIGVRHVQDWKEHTNIGNEERVREQVSIALNRYFTTRLRFEQRFHSAGPQVGVRLRPQLRFTLPLDATDLALLATHESFVNFNTTRWGQRSGYERMRHAVALSIPLARNLKVDVGYLNQIRFGRAGARDTMEHAGTTSVTITL